jgi:UDP-N-acetylglucosamine--N-acetylmuramyl-(pentapeptide) pyrophosphoryl-undecaprenol N-acetylglucosamine transferase
MSGRTFVMAGGGTGGHVIPALAVAAELRARGHEAVFVGTKRGMEARLVPAAGFRIEWIEIGGLMSVGWRQALTTAAQLPLSCWRAGSHLRANGSAAVFSLGGYVAGPVMLAAMLQRVPMVLMEPNAVPGVTNRKMGRFVYRALVSFEETSQHFPAGKAEVTGLPVRREFFRSQPRPRGDTLSVLITGGSRGSRTLNNAFRGMWPLWRQAPSALRVVHQCGREEAEALRRDFEATGLEGMVCPFIEDMAAAFAGADAVVGRSGAGAVSELAAAGKPSILIPFPYASEQHQLRNAEAMVRAGAARMVPDEELTGPRLWQELLALGDSPGLLSEMSASAKKLARPDAARRAADTLEEAAGAVDRKP